MTGKSIPKTDCDQLLTLFCEDRHTPSTVSSNNRGIFCCLKDKSIVARGLPYPLECSADTFNSKVHNDPFDGCHVTMAIEGPVIIVFYHKDRWYLSTNRKLNAFKSYWADPKSSFGLMFAYGVFSELKRDDLLKLTEAKVIKEELDKVFDQYLDRSNRYIFIQPPTYNERLATVPIGEHHVPVHVATFAYQDIIPSPGHDRLTRIRAKVPFANTPPEYRLPNAASCDLYKHVCKLANKVDPNKAQGVIIEVPDGTFIKVFSTEYKKRLQVRGTVSSLKGRYMQLRKAPPATLDEFITYYPEVDHEAIEKSIAEACSILETVCLLMVSKVNPDHIGSLLEHMLYPVPHVVESIALSKVLYTNLLQNKQVVKVVEESMGHPQPYTTFERLSFTNTPIFRNLTDIIKFETTKARYTIEGDIQSQIDFLNGLDIESFF